MDIGLTAALHQADAATKTAATAAAGIDKRFDPPAAALSASTRTNQL